MKFQLFALLLVVAGACAMPPANDAVVVDSLDQAAPRIIVEGQIRRIIQQISDAIKLAGYDPLEIESEERVLVLEEFFIDVKAFVQDLRFVGASNIRIHSLDYNLVLNRLRFDISLPQISLSVGNSGVEGSAFNNEIKGQLSGSFVIESIRISGEVRVNIGIISGISLRSVSLNFRVGDIRSQLSFSAQGTDFSDELNNLLNVRLPKALEDNRADINRLLENLVREVFERLG